MKIFIFIVFFYTYKIPLIIFVSFLNNTYFIFLFYSILVWFNLLPNLFYNPMFFNVPEFFIDFGFISYHILPSIQGGPAALSVYSALILIINLVYFRKNYLFILLGLLGLLLTFRLTPMFSIILVLLLFPLYKNKFLSFIVVFSIFNAFILILYGLFIDFSFKFNGVKYDLWSLGYIATHARTMIWEQQINLFFEKYTWWDYIFGNYSVALFEVPHYQLWGEIRNDGLHANPHNTFLLLFFRGPLLFIIFFVAFLFSIFNNFSRNNFIIIFIIYISSYTNSMLISLGNPIFLLILIYFLTYKASNEK